MCPKCKSANWDRPDGAPSGEAAATPQETVPPAPSSATVDGATLTITFGEELTETPAPVAGCQVTAGTVHQAPVSAVGFQKNKAKENPP